jgi:integrase
VKGSMREKRPGYWQLRVFEGTDPLTGKKRYRTKAFRGTKRQAQSALAVLVTEVDGGVVEPKKCTVAELLDAWLDHIEHIGRSPSTLYGYRRLVRQLPEGFLGQPIGKVTSKVLDDLYRLLSKQTSRKAATVLRFHSLLRAAFHQAVRWGWLERNPVERATPPRVEQVETVPPVVADVLRVLDAAAAPRNPENAVVFRLVAATGCRRGEVCGLKWSAVDIDGDMPRVMIRRGVLDIERQRIVRDTKNHGVRWVGLDPETAKLLRRHRDRSFELGKVAGSPVTADDFVFPSHPEAPNRSRRTGSARPGAGSAESSASTRVCTTSATSKRRCSSMREKPSPPCRPVSVIVIPRRH